QALVLDSTCTMLKHPILDTRCDASLMPGFSWLLSGGFFRLRRSSALGCPAPRLSPGTARWRAPFLLLYVATPDTRSPTTSLALGLWARHRFFGSRTLGALRSEIKEEDGAAVRGTFAEQCTQWPRASARCNERGEALSEPTRHPIAPV